MKALRIHAYGEDPRLDDVPPPEIKGPWDVVVRIGAAGLCRTDLHVLEGQWEKIQQPKLPYILGHENAGWVESVGSAVTNVAIGDAVIMHPLVTCGLCPACRNGNDSHCTSATFPGLNTDGGMAELMLTNARSVLKLPTGTEPTQVAALADAGLTAYHAVRKAVPLLSAGTTAVVLGCGGLGHIGVQTLRALTATRIIVVDKSEAALQLATDLGADETILADGDLSETLLAKTDGGAHVVFDFIGEHGMENLGVSLLRNQGSYYSIGYGGTLKLDTIEIVSREINVVGNLVGTYQDLVELMQLASAGKVQLDSHVYPLDDALEAFQLLQEGKIRGRVVLVP